MKPAPIRKISSLSRNVSANAAAVQDLIAENLTDQELDTLHKGVAGAGLLVSLSDRSFFDTFKEAGALAKHLAQARRDASSPIVQQLAGKGGTGFGITSQPSEIEQGAVEALRSSVSILQAKAPDQVDAYKSFVIEVAQSVGNAAAGGEAAEGEAIQKIRTALDSA